MTAVSGPPPLEVRELTKIYGETRAVDGITFALRPGEITALLGGNGAGKTTTISMMMGLVVPTKGLAWQGARRVLRIDDAPFDQYFVLAGHRAVAALRRCEFEVAIRVDFTLRAA